MNSPTMPPAPALDFGHEALLGRVERCLRQNLEQAQGQPGEAPPLVVGLFGEWGSGKSHLLEAVGRRVADWRHVQKENQVEHHVVVPFNAWRFEREEHLLIPLLKVAQQALLKSLESDITADIRQREQLSDRVLLLGDLASSIYAHGGKEALQMLWAWHTGAAGTLMLSMLEAAPGDAGSGAAASDKPAPETGKTPATAAAGTKASPADKNRESAWAAWQRKQKALGEARQLKTPIDALHSLYFDFQEHLKAVTGRNPKALKLHRKRLRYGGLGWWPQTLHAAQKLWLWLQRPVQHAFRPAGAGAAPEPTLKVNLVFLVDDLDRCLPDKAVEVLEAIKLFLEVPGCVFVLALDEEVVERGIAHRYRDYALQGKAGLTPITGAEYLEKLVHLPVRLPRPSRRQSSRHLAVRQPAWFTQAGQTGLEPNALADWVAALTPPVPRKLHRMEALLTMAEETLGANAHRLGVPPEARHRWLALACALQLFSPVLFRYLRVHGAYLLEELVNWREQGDLRDLTRLKRRLERARRQAASPQLLAYQMKLERLPDLVQDALHNRSGFDLLEVLGRAQELMQQQKLEATALGAMLSFVLEDDGSAVAPGATFTVHSSVGPGAAKVDLPSAADEGPAAALSETERRATPGDAAASAAADEEGANATGPNAKAAEPTAQASRDGEAAPHQPLDAPKPAHPPAPQSGGNAPDPAHPHFPNDPTLPRYARLENPFAFQEAVRSGDVRVVKNALSVEGQNLLGRLLPDELVEEWCSDKRSTWLQPQQPLSLEAKELLKELAPHLSQWAALRLAVATRHLDSTLRSLGRLSWTSDWRFMEGAPRDWVRLAFSAPSVLAAKVRPELEAMFPLTVSALPEHVQRWRLPNGLTTTTAALPAASPTILGGDEFGLFADLTLNGVAQRFRWIEPGSFWMGSEKAEQEAAAQGSKDALKSFANESPRHRVKLTQGFWLADTACTQALWLAVVGGENPSHFKGEEDLPVERVSWDDITQKFLPKLQAWLPEGVEAVLPSEGQWEYACRAGTQTPFSFGEQISPALVNYEGNYPYNGGFSGEYREKTVPVKALPANGWGLYQMHGNVYEWCVDGMRDYEEGEAVDPVGAVGDGPRAVRGGSWYDGARRARSVHRGQFGRDRRIVDLGFRVALRFKPGQGAEP